MRCRSPFVMIRKVWLRLEKASWPSPPPTAVLMATCRAASVVPAAVPASGASSAKRKAHPVADGCQLAGQNHCVHAALLRVQLRAEVLHVLSQLRGR